MPGISHCEEFAELFASVILIAEREYSVLSTLRSAACKLQTCMPKLAFQFDIIQKPKIQVNSNKNKQIFPKYTYMQHPTSIYSFIHKILNCGLILATLSKFKKG
jgi:hypothetical protein